jgi:hypothetical protein
MPIQPDHLARREPHLGCGAARAGQKTGVVQPCPSVILARFDFRAVEPKVNPVGGQLVLRILEFLRFALLERGSLKR